MFTTIYKSLHFENAFRRYSNIILQLLDILLKCLAKKYEMTMVVKISKVTRTWLLQEIG